MLIFVVASVAVSSLSAVISSIGVEIARLAVIVASVTSLARIGRNRIFLNNFEAATSRQVIKSHLHEPF